MSLNSPWLSDWRTYADEADMAPKARRMVEQAITTTEQVWADRHEASYRGRAALRFEKRDTQVIGACEDMAAPLREIRDELAAGRMTPAQARSEVRTMAGRHKQITDLHETIVAEDPDLETFAEMTPDDYQREVLQKTMPALLQVQPTLAGVVEGQTPPPRPGGGLGPNSSFVPTNDAPSADDLV
jgi:hypothetical protein